MGYKYKVGDVVKLVSKRAPNWNFDGYMDEFLGSIQTIRSIGMVSYDEGREVCFENAKTRRWTFYEDSIECKVDPETIPEAVQVNLIEERKK